MKTFQKKGLQALGGEYPISTLTGESKKEFIAFIEKKILESNKELLRGIEKGLPKKQILAEIDTHPDDFMAVGYNQCLSEIKQIIKSFT